jgi:hexosaminidase
LIPKNIGGIILTGWQRFDHFASLCELLPVGIPSLCCCLAALDARNFGDSELERCSNELGLDLGAELRGEEVAFREVRPNFPGSNVYVLVRRFTELQRAYNSLIKSDTLTTWFADYNLQRGRFSPLQVEFIHSNFRNLLIQFREMEESLQLAMSTIYPISVCNEWVGTYIEPIIADLTKNFDKASIVLNKRPT